MIRMMNDSGKDTIIFADIIEDAAIEQVEKLARGEVYRDSKIRVMPDVHAGKDCTIGTTMTLHGKVAPNLVGVDIACGVLVVAIKEKDIDLLKLDEIIHSRVPHGFNVHQQARFNFDLSLLRCKHKVDIERAGLSIGTLGGGNHFIELAKDESNGDLFLVIHTGSRKLGMEVCSHYQSIAEERASSGISVSIVDMVSKLKKEGREKEISNELKKLRRKKSSTTSVYLEGEDFENYIHDISVVHRFACANRKAIADTIIDGMGWTEVSRFETLHNYIDTKRMILRKGAVSAERGELLIIPLNMRDGSLICVGKGNPEWNYSAPHGAGRLLSRKKARLELSFTEYAEQMSNIYTSSVSEATLDEAPSAYKPVEYILDSIKDTVEVVKVVKPIYNFKSH